jgi:hypothetical protein
MTHEGGNIDRCCGARRNVCGRALLRCAWLEPLGLALDDRSRYDARLRSCNRPILGPCVVVLPPTADSPPLSFGFSFPSSAARSCLSPPPFVTPARLRAGSGCLDASPSTGRDGLLEPLELTCAREGTGGGVIEVSDRWGNSKVMVLSMRLDLLT